MGEQGGWGNDGGRQEGRKERREVRVERRKGAICSKGDG